MGLRLIVDETADTDGVAMYDSVTGWAFGPVFDSREAAEDFLAWLAFDARTLNDKDLGEMYDRWARLRARV